MSTCSRNNRSSSSSGFGRFLRLPWLLLAIAIPIVGIAATTHQWKAMMVAWAPYAIFLLCPLMPLFHRSTSGAKVASPSDGDGAPRDSHQVNR